MGLSHANSIKPAVYADIRREIRDGYLLFWTPTNLGGRFIQRGTDGPYCHVGSVSWVGDVLETHEQLQFRGGQTLCLSHYAEKYPGKIHVHRVEGISTYVFSQRQRRRAGTPYGWRDIGGIALKLATNDLLRLPSRKRLCEIDHDASPEEWDRLYVVPMDAAPYCSEAVVSDLRMAGAKVLPLEAAWEVTPNMLAEVTEYLFTLYWTPQQVEVALRRQELQQQKELREELRRAA